MLHEGLQVTLNLFHTYCRVYLVIINNSHMRWEIRAVFSEWFNEPPWKEFTSKKQVCVDSERRRRPNLVFHNLTKHDLSVSSSCCAPWRFTGDSQPCMCYYYVLVSPTFDLGFIIEKRNAGKNFRKWRAVSRANAALWGHNIYLGFRVEKKLS